MENAHHNTEKPPTEQGTITTSPPSEETWYQCDKCGFETRQDHILDWHKSEHTTNVDAGELDSYKCGKCDFQCKCILDFEKHFSFVHCHHCNVKDNPKDVFDWDFRDITGVELAKIFVHWEMHHHFGTDQASDEQNRVELFRDALKSVRTRMFGDDPYFDSNLNEFMSFYVCRVMLPCNCMSAEVKCAVRRTVNRAREDNVDF